MPARRIRWPLCIRSVVICLLAFAAFLRFDELSKPVRSDVKIENDMLKFFIQSSKTDQYRDGAWIVVASQVLGKQLVRLL